ncbi:AAA family ATPase [Nonomuraea sp. NPDC049480]|uniref:helix-turn-helix transcriptional regulator n=1 Tax=Nonomuraea sp. NPDC049480 TaxID=3364353 RepID=UPI003790E3A2
MYPLVGREHMLSVLVDHLNATLEGSGGFIVLEGPIGIGRTRMLKAAAFEGAERGFTVAYIRTGVIDQPTPLRELITFLRHVMPSESEFDDLVRPDINPFCLADRLAELIANAARRRPLLIALDDAQRADEVSGLALQGLVQSLVSSPVLWLLARRPVPAQSLAQHAIGWLIDRAAGRLHLGPLDNEAVAALCTSVLGAKPDSSVLRWAAHCGGNPWLLENLLSALMDAGQVVIVDGTASVLADCLPGCVLSAVARRLDELPSAVRRLLVHGRRIGHAFTVEEAADLLSASPPDLSSSVEEAVQAGLIRRNGAKLAFVHDVIGEALQHVPFRDVEPAPSVPVTGTMVRPSGRISVAEPNTARAEPPPNGRAIAPPPPQSQACGCDEITAQAISALGDPFDEAPRALARPLCLLAGAGRAAEARRLADVAVRAGIEAAAEAQLMLDLAQGLQDAGCHGMSVECLQRTLARRDLREVDRGKLEGSLADTAKRVKSVPGAGPTVGNGRSTSLARPLIVDRRARAGGDTGATGWGVRVAESLQEPVHPYRDTCERPLWAWMVRALVAADQFEEASAVCAAIKQESEKLGEAWPEPLWHGHLAELLVTAGRLDEARVAAETGLRLTDRSAPEDSVSARAVLARISLHHGDTATASEHLRMAERLVSDDAVPDKTDLNWALAQFHAASGRPGMAVQTLINVEGEIAPDLVLFTEAPTAAAMLVRLARKAGLSAEAEGAADFARRISEGNPTVASLAGGAEHAEGLLRHDPVALRHAVEHYRLSGRPLATGIALEDAAQEEQNIRHQAQAVQFLGSALDLYVDCGARRDITRVQKKLRRLGVHNVRALGAERPTSGWESLTSAELRVVRAIVDGKTNKEAASMLFLSPHTVDSHLRRVFAKLSINSRVELTKQFIAHETS